MDKYFEAGVCMNYRFDCKEAVASTRQSGWCSIGLVVFDHIKVILVWARKDVNCLHLSNKISFGNMVGLAISLNRLQ